MRLAAFRAGERLYSVASVIVLPARFRDARRLGHGGMGDIVLATDAVLDRQVVIKLLAERYAEDESIRKRFTREALAAARLSSAPNTVTIFDVGETAQGRPFIVMEYLPGGSLDDQLQRGPVEPEQALVWLGQAARALDAAHAKGIVHRDIKPANLLLDNDGDAHVADFGVARAADLDPLTVAGTVVGTAGYLSPEQARGEPADAASDRYALGVLAFELLTGERPFRRDTTAAEAAAHVHEPVPSIHERNPSLPPALDRCFGRALAKDPADRFRTNTEFVRALREALAASEGTTRRTRPPAPATAPTRTQRQRHPWRIPAIVAVLAALAAVGALVASALVGDGDDSASNTPSVVTQVSTKEGERVTVTETIEPPPTPPPPSPPPSPQPSPSPPASPPPASSAGGRALTDQATNLMRQGRYAAALPIAQQALAKLQGSGQLYEAYANYNVGRSLIELGRCEEGLPYIAASERIQGHRAEFGEARAKCAAG